MGLRPTQGDEKDLLSPTALHGSVALSFVIPRACDFFIGMTVFPGYSHPYQNKIVIPTGA
jgi:hypothetical protein